MEKKERDKGNDGGRGIWGVPYAPVISPFQCHCFSHTKRQGSLEPKLVYKLIPIYAGEEVIVVIHIDHQ